MLTYSSYLKTRTNLVPTGLVAAFASSSFELLAGFGVFATLGFMAHTQGVGVDELTGVTGVGLSFFTFPQIISSMPGGQIFGVMFFGSLLIAGFTSFVSILEVIVAAVREKFAISRPTRWRWPSCPRSASSRRWCSSPPPTGSTPSTSSTPSPTTSASSLPRSSECVVVVLVVRNLKDLQHHLNQTSTLHLGAGGVGSSP